MRYREVAEALAEGDYVLMASLAQLSCKLKPFPRLLGTVVGERMAKAFILSRFDEGASEPEIDRLLRGDARDELPLARAFRLAAPYFPETDIESFRRRAGAEVVACFERNEPLVLPVVGTSYRPSFGQLVELVTDLRRAS